jgi:IgA Peptidase M64
LQNRVSLVHTLAEWKNMCCASRCSSSALLKKRDPQNNFREVWSAGYDPKDTFLDRSRPAVDPGPVINVEIHGDSAHKVDFLILGDGYTAAERGKCEADARRLTSILFGTSPFKERREDFNVRALCPAAAQSGISRPSTGIWRSSPAGATYDAFGSERYVLRFENRKLRELASFAPCEFIEVLVNGNTYGGGGIFGLYSAVAADSLWAPYIFVHEFGHHFAGLADEYYTSDVSYNPPATRGEPMGAECDGVAGSRSVEVEAPGLAGHSDPDAVGQKVLRGV